MKLAIALLASLACAGCTVHLDQPITVKKGDRSLGRHTVDGTVRLEDGASGRGLSSVAGGGLETTSGTIHLSGKTTVDGGIELVALKPGDNNADVTRLPLVLIGPGVRVLGSIHAARGATLVASRDAALGPVQGVTVIRVDGDPNL